MIDQQPMRPETIEAAAVIFEGNTISLPSPARHHTILRHICDTISSDGRALVPPDDQGFLTNSGRFVQRKEAGEIALAANQIACLQWPPSLFSEDLW